MPIDAHLSFKDPKCSQSGLLSGRAVDKLLPSQPREPLQTPRSHLLSTTIENPQHQISRLVALSDPVTVRIYPSISPLVDTYHPQIWQNDDQVASFTLGFQISPSATTPNGVPTKQQANLPEGQGHSGGPVIVLPSLIKTSVKNSLPGLLLLSGDVVVLT
ncbi:hypothetical protein BDZ45DRAFT_324083 [Acephala macrosclerotiorum]|nr:hypothetical protein BDZ45DRAFT_324083 [Acephala macrosclerotiorum]